MFYDAMAIQRWRFLPAHEWENSRCYFDLGINTHLNQFAHITFAFKSSYAHTLNLPIFLTLSRLFKSLCCEILKYSQVYEPYRSIVGQERGRTHRDLNERRKIKSNINQINPNLV